MAVTSAEVTCDKIPTKSSCSTHSSKGGNSCRVLKFNFDGSCSSAASRHSKAKKNNSRSPYLTSDRVQLLSRVTEKRMVHKKTTDFISSFPLAVNIYKANSDEFKSAKKVNRKVKKSVLTLPNDPAPTPQVCTVSDMNDSEYCEKNYEDRKQKVIKKRTPIQNNRKARVREKDFEFYDRDAQYCSQLDLDCSSTDMMKNFNGDGKRLFKKKEILPPFPKPPTAKNNLSDVWSVLRNINRFQFRPSPPMSEESIIPIKKKVQKRRANRKDTRLIETCRRTEEFAYISSYEMEKSPRSLSPSSSIDRITVIDKQNEFSKICEEFEKRLLKTHDFVKDSNNTKGKNQKNKIQCRNAKNNLRAIGSIGIKDNKTLKKKKRTNFKSPADRPTTNSSVCKDSLIDDYNLKIVDNSDVVSTALDSMHPAKGSYTYSVYSGSSKTELIYETKNEDTPDHYPDEFSFQSQGISRVGLGKEKVLETSDIPKRFDPLTRKPRLVTTMPSSSMTPKLTQTEIKRRLAHFRFPVVILGKDQVSSNVKVMNYDPPQFNGLEDHIWPFMMEWSESATMNSKNHIDKLNKKYNSYLSESNSGKSHKTNHEITTYKTAATKDKKQSHNYLSSYKKKAEIKRLMPCPEISDKIIQSSKKQKSIVQLKDKMLNFLYKKSSSRNIINDIDKNCVNENEKFILNGSKIDENIDTQIRSVVIVNDSPKKRASRSPIATVSTNKKGLNYAYPWSKAKWASDFIENVIKKIKCGVYYNQDYRDAHKYKIGLKEVSVQAGSFCDSTGSTQTYDSDTELAHEVTFTTKNKNNINIPGFNDTLPLLEIKTLNMNQIAVKHCVTNVMVQFDVTVPSKSDHRKSKINKCLPLIPIETTDSHMKIYKCNTTILNAMLPAELCSILPKMIRNITDTNVSSDPALCPVKTDSCLSTITESTRFDNGDSSSLLSPIPSIHMSPEMKQLLEGRFTNKHYLKNTITNQINFVVNYNSELATELLPEVSLKDIYRYEVSPLLVELDNNTRYIRTQIALQHSNKQLAITGLSVKRHDIQNLNSTAVDVYTRGNEKVNLPFNPNNFVGMVEGMLRKHNLQINLNLTSYFDMLKLQYDGKNIKISISITNAKGVQKNMSVTVSNLKVDSLYKAAPKIKNNRNNRNINNASLKCIEYTSSTCKLENTELNQVSGLSGNRNKRKGFYKPYRKCKSTTNIPSGEKCMNTPLNKVTNLDDFFQILGSKKMLCSVFDGYAAKKILSSLVEMKNWVTEINPKQALLILLLTNKKDTPNLVRFRPILLQGIAVNRITRATELDMEIEVIEREHLNKFSQYEGISYLPDSVTNYDNLLEELYWIAKTTASDYQRPFDESSERLLKSLLEKRKKLNPSYLRVMARYVGLGLLKSPTKK